MRQYQRRTGATSSVRVRPEEEEEEERAAAAAEEETVAGAAARQSFTGVECRRV